MTKTAPADLNALSLDALWARLIGPRELFELIDRARWEDLGAIGDVTSAACIDADREATARLRARQPGRLAGAKLIGSIAKRYDPALTVRLEAGDGDAVDAGQTVARLAGPLRSMLAAERVLLNFITHLSGIATLTGRYVDRVGESGAKVYDTRKTLPGLRHLAKYAVRCGDGCCHRIGLHDAVLIKDNHLAHLGADDLRSAVDAAVRRVRAMRPAPAFVEVEVDTLEQLEPILACDVDIVLLDNFRPKMLEQAVALRDQADARVALEASGGISLETVAAVAATGVDRIAVGALTHSAPALDFGLDIE